MTVTYEKVTKIHEFQSSQVERWLRWFEKDGEKFIGELELKNLDFSELKRVFNPSLDDPFMYYCYAINTLEKIQFIQGLINVKLDLLKYEYFVECNSI